MFDDRRAAVLFINAATIVMHVKTDLLEDLFP